MINGEKVLAIIPARGGAKRIPRKNLREFRGLPLFAWAVIPARASKFIDRIVVSTEDNEIKGLAQRMRLNVIDRPQAQPGHRHGGSV